MLEQSISYTTSNQDRRKAQSPNIPMHYSEHNGGVLSRATSKLINPKVCPTAVCIKCPWKLKFAWARILYKFRGHTLESLVQHVVYEQIV